MIPSLTDQKSFLRRHYLNLRKSVGGAEKTSKILARLLSLDEWKNADIICAYMPVRGEISIIPVIQKALSENKKVALPKTVTGASEGEMVFRFVSSLDDLAEGRFGILEPLDGCDELCPSQHRSALCILPALAFDRFGYRLGYGGGYYDRFLENFSGISVGLAYSECLSESPLPHGELDAAADIIISESEVIRINERK